MEDMLMLATMDRSADDTTKQAMKSPASEKWVEACAAEVASLVEIAMFAVVDRPADKLVITSKWVFKDRRELSAQVQKYKARLLARGFMQEEVYLDIPERMFAKELPGKVLRLLQAMYGLQQSPRIWNLHIQNALSEFSTVDGDAALTRWGHPVATGAVLQGGPSLIPGREHSSSEHSAASGLKNLSAKYITTCRG